MMPYNPLGGSGLKVPALSLGTGTFGGSGELFQSWGSAGVAEATRLVDICLEAGVNLFDSADNYSKGLAEEILGKAVKGRRDEVLISTKTTVIIGARNEEQLRQNLGAVGWDLTAEQVAKLDAASARPAPYPYWHQQSFSERNPFPV